MNMTAASTPLNSFASRVASKAPHNHRLKLTGAAILVSRGKKVLQAAANPSRFDAVENYKFLLSSRNRDPTDGSVGGCAERFIVAIVRASRKR